MCILSQGGLKAVIWTDVLQMIIMLAGFVAVIARGAVIQGGLTRIWEDAGEGGRLDAFECVNKKTKRSSLTLANFDTKLVFCQSKELD